MTTTTQQTWLTKLQPYDYEIQYKKGTDNTAADALSRVDSNLLSILTIQMHSDELLLAVKESWQQDQKIAQLITELESNPHSHFKCS